MPTPIKFFKDDPNKKGRGPGIYYHRGHGYYSQYSIARDKARKSEGWEEDKVGLPRDTRYPHISDGYIEFGRSKPPLPKEIKKKYMPRKK